MLIFSIGLAAPPPLPRAARVLVADALRSAATDAPAALPRPRAVVTPRARPAAGRLSFSPPPPPRRLVYQVCDQMHAAIDARSDPRIASRAHPWIPLLRARRADASSSANALCTRAAAPHVAKLALSCRRRRVS